MDLSGEARACCWGCLGGIWSANASRAARWLVPSPQPTRRPQLWVRAVRDRPITQRLLGASGVRREAIKY